MLARAFMVLIGLLMTACCLDVPDLPECRDVCYEVGTVCCAGRCVNLSRDVQNCGTCGTACGSGHVCEYGRCQALDMSMSASDLASPVPDLTGPDLFSPSPDLASPSPDMGPSVPDQF